MAQECTLVQDVGQNGQAFEYIDCPTLHLQWLALNINKVNSEREPHRARSTAGTVAGAGNKVYKQKWFHPVRQVRNIHRERGGKDRYAIPPQELVCVLGLKELIAGVRSIVPEQQARFPSDEGIWCVGDMSLVQKKCVAIVGTRNVSAEGAARSRRLARELVLAGVVVVSGLAKGVDKEALTAAIEAGGRVVAVIGTPVDRAYPAENKHLQERIYRDHLLISQFPPGERVYQSNFPERNKLMAALSDATAITEAGDTSGSLHQAAECVRLGRWLFIARNLVDNPALEWPKRFREQPTTRILTSTDDILHAIGVA